MAPSLNVTLIFGIIERARTVHYRLFEKKRAGEPQATSLTKRR
jgi:hypothetical protein